MYFIKFIYQTFLLPPGLLITFLLILSCVYGRSSRKLFLLFLLPAVYLYLCSTTFVSGLLLRPLESRYLPPTAPTGDVIILLGGGAVQDTPNRHGQGHLAGSAANRLLTALTLHRELDIPIILSGGQVYQTSGREADIAAHICLSLGIPPDDIMIENQSRNTTENALRITGILRKNNFHRPLLVTSAFHMPRAVRQFEKAGVKVLPYPTDYRTNRSFRFSGEQLIPTAEALNEVNLALKEYLGLLVARWY